jgi:hypothetical protein
MQDADTEITALSCYSAVPRPWFQVKQIDFVLPRSGHNEQLMSGPLETQTTRLSLHSRMMTIQCFWFEDQTWRPLRPRGTKCPQRMASTRRHGAGIEADGEVGWAEELRRLYRALQEESRYFAAYSLVSPAHARHARLAVTSPQIEEAWPCKTSKMTRLRPMRCPNSDWGQSLKLLNLQLTRDPALDDS